MNSRRRNRRNRIIRAYIARVVVVLVLILAIVLMWCGCLYVRDHVFRKETDKDNTQVTQTDTPTDLDNDVKEPEPEPEPLPRDAVGLTIVLDAGHGGNDGGTVSADESVIEKEINLSVVFKMKDVLEQRGATVILTRDEDEWMELSDRSYISNQTGADIFVSMHCNSYEDTSISGLECFYHPKSEIGKTYAEEFIQRMIADGNIITRYADGQNYQVLRDSSIPALLIEMGYLSNPVDVQNLPNFEWQDKLVRSVTDCLIPILKGEEFSPVGTTTP